MRLVIVGFAATWIAIVGCSSTHNEAAGSTASSCDALQACCSAASFPGTGKAGCDSIVQMGNDADCAQALASSRAASFCADGDGGAATNTNVAPDGGSHDASSTVGSSCGLLQVCCQSGSFPSSEKGACNAVIGTNDDKSCALSLSSDEMAGFCAGICGSDADCGGTTPACDTTQHTCVQCTDDSRCSGPASKCCSRKCADTATDPDNCGACGATVPAGLVCTAGKAACPGGLTPCGTACVNTSTDAANCGACGRSCSAGSTCTGGKCELTITATTPESCSTACGSMMLGCIGVGWIEYGASPTNPNQCPGTSEGSSTDTCDTVPASSTTDPGGGCTDDPFASIQCTCGS